MGEYIALDVHKRYSFMERQDMDSGQARRSRIDHGRGVFGRALKGAAAGTVVALEATGNWYWIVEELEQAGLKPVLVHPRKAKMMLACVNKSDALDVSGMNRLQRVGTLPTVWVAPGPIRDQRELPRTRMFLAGQRTALKNRIQATLTKHNLQVTQYSDPFGKAARVVLASRLGQLPEQTRFVVETTLEQLDVLEERIGRLEKRIEALIAQTPAMRRLMSAPGIGRILATVIALEIGDIHRFATAERLASYCGTTPRLHASGDRIRHGHLRFDVNHYLKWALIEAANCIRLNKARHPQRHVSRLYNRIAKSAGHAKATGAVARHLAEALWHMGQREVDYQEPPSHGRRAR